MSGYLSRIPDTGSDVTLIGLNHLHHLGLSKQVLQPPPQAKRFTADGSEVAPLLGSFKANVTFADNATATWIDVHEILPTPLLSYRDCKDLAIISEDFPKPILEVTHANRLHETDVTSPACSPTTRPSTTPPPHTSSQLPFTTSTTPAQAMEFFLSEFSDVLVTKELYLLLLQTVLFFRVNS